MAKKTKTPTAPNWRTGEGYPEYSSAQTDRLLDKLWHIEDLADAGECVRLTVAG